MEEPNTSTVTLEQTRARSTKYDRASSSASKLPLPPQQTSEYQDHDETERSPPGTPWRPTMLRRWVFALCAMLFLLLIVSLEVVLKVSTDRHGFGPTEYNLYYIWTYGPTTVFTVIAAFWTQVDYRTRQMLPWEELAKGPQPAANGLLLDYISPNPVVAFYRSVKHRHGPVAAVLLGSFLIKILIVVSTGLFMLNPVIRPQLLPMVRTEQFSFSGFNASSVDDAAGLMYAGALLDEMDYLPGTNGEYAVELFNPSKTIKADTYILTATSRTFTADLSCEPAKIDPNATIGRFPHRGMNGSLPPQTPQPYCEGSVCSGFFTMLAHTKDCYISVFDEDIRGLAYPVMYDDKQWYGGVLLGTCDGQDDDLDRERIVVFSASKVTGPVLTYRTAFFCTPSFRIQQSAVTIDQSGNLKSVGHGTPLSVPNNLTSLAIFKAVKHTIDQINPLLVPDSYGWSAVDYTMDSFILVILRLSGSKNVTDLWDGEMIVRGAEKIFKGVAVQLAKQYFLTATSMVDPAEFEGTAEYKQQRLFVRNLSLRLLDSILCVLTVVCMIFALRPRRHTVSQDPASIARLSSIISLSRNFNVAMSSTGSLSLKTLEGVLSGSYGAVFLKNANGSENKTPRFVIKSHEALGPKPIPLNTKYWQPLSTSWYFRLALLAVPLGLIVALEITYRKSQRNNGLLDVAANKWTQYGSGIVPALVMVLTKLLFSSADFDLRIIDPYVQLKKGFARARTSVLNKTIYTWKTDAFWAAFMNGRVAVGASTLGVIVASFLTVAASGLFNTVTIAHQRAASLTRVDSFFDPTIMVSGLGNVSNNYRANTGARLVAYDRVKSPQWTFGPYVIPTLASSELSEGLNTVSLIDVDLLVRRGHLACELVPQGQVSLNYTPWEAGHMILGPGAKYGVTVRWTMTNLSNCIGSDVRIRDDGPFGSWHNYWNPDAPCPTSSGVYGTWVGRRAEELNVVLCWSSIQELQASLQFSMPEWEVRSLQADERTMRTISSNTDTQLDIGVHIFNGPRGHISTELDGSFSTFLWNSTMNTEDASLLQHNNFEDLYARIQDIYGRATAQILNIQGRYTNLTTTNTTIPATATIHSTFRLRQNLVSTRILQGLLIAMAICASILFLTSDPRNVVPKNPCSIAAQASLVADSVMMKELPPEAQWMNDKEFDALFEGARYSMEWDDEEDGQGRFGIDVDLRPRPQKMVGWLKWR